MDARDLEILRACLPGDREFPLKGNSEEEVESFNDWGDRLLGLKDLGYLEIPDGLIQPNHQGGKSKYYRIGVRRVTAEGRKELKRREPPDSATVEMIRAKIEDIADRGQAFSRRVRDLELLSGPYSSAQMELLDRLIEDEYGGRGQVFLDAWRAVLAAQGLLLSAPVARVMNDELWHVFSVQSTDLQDAFQEFLAHSRDGRTEADLSRIQEAARRRIEADINYAALTGTTQTPLPMTHGRGEFTHQNVFNLTGTSNRINIASEDNSQNIVNITPGELFDELRKAIELQVADLDERKRLLGRLEDLERAQSTPYLGQRYIDFMAAAASHATVIGPYLPALAQLFQPG